ncbi:hypothetical protein GGR50DRAFT_689449 [Xylaria sp. CBS 124048]|nr:hypothetical protein GGR50DRAFT_689449 [Xylaria sp. CBS 124048]
MSESRAAAMNRIHPNKASGPRPMSWSAIPADDPAAHEHIIKFISESIVDDIQSNISSGFMRQVHASKKSIMSPHDKAERMRLVRDMRTTLERLTEELGQRFFEEYRHRPAVGRWYDSWLFNSPPTFLRWEQEWAFTSDEPLATAAARSISDSTDGLVSGSETTPEVRLEFGENLEDFDDTEEFGPRPEYRPDAPETEKKTDSPMLPSTGCQCRHAEGEGSDSGDVVHLCQTCACSDQGQGCIASCGCDETCRNNFNSIALDSILGADVSERVDFNACFISYLQKLELTEAINLEYLFDHLLTGLRYVPDGNDEAIDAWRVEWETSYNGPDPEAKTEALQRELIRLGLRRGDGQGNGQGDWFFSFCYNRNEQIGSWQQGNQIWHCRDCKRCIDWQMWWHCEQCNKCQYGRKTPCGGCGGVSKSYHENHDRRVSLHPR